MPNEIIIWSAASHCWRAVRRSDPDGSLRFEPLSDAMTGELARRAFVSAMRFAEPLTAPFAGPSAWQPNSGAWDD